MCARCSEEYLGVTGVLPLTEWCKAKIPKNAFMFSQQNALWRTGSIPRSEVSAAVEALCSRQSPAVCAAN